MTKLNQIVAVVTGQKSRTEKEITEVYKKVQKEDLFNGLVRKYTPLDEEGEQLPTETKNVQYTAQEAVGEFKTSLGKLFDVVATQDWTNCEAKADVVVGDEVVLESVPVTHLMFLEKQLNDIGTFISKLPTLEAGERWNFSENDDCYVSEVSQNNRTQKLPQTIVKAEATEHHPAQVDVYMKDVITGKWDVTKMSGAMKKTEKKEMLERVEELKNAVKFAREEANDTEVNKKTSSAILDYVFK